MFSIIERIQQVLVSIYGQAKTSLSLGDCSKSKGQVYYQIEHEDEFASLLNYFHNQYKRNMPFSLDGTTYPFYDSRFDNSKKKCYVLCTEDEQCFNIQFCPIDGIVYHRSYGKRIVARIYSANDALLNLQVRKSDGMLNIHDRGGLHQFALTRWVNKCLYNNIELRDFIVKLMKIYGEINPVFRDIARTVDKNHFFLLPLYFYEMLECHTPSDLMKRVRHKLLDINYNKYDLNYSYYLTFMSKYFDDSSKNLIKAIPPEQLLSFVQPKDLLLGLDVKRFLEQYYSSMPTSEESRNVSFTVNDYFEMCNDHQEVPKLFRSLGALIKDHDRLTERYKREALSDELKKPLVVQNSRFDALNKTLLSIPMEDFEWIQSTERLYEEGERQHNCVFSYRFAIRNDRCSIWHLNRHNKSYTIRFELNYRNDFVLSEMRDMCNKHYLQEDYSFVNQLVRQANKSKNEAQEKEKLQGLFGTEVQVI